MGRTKKEPNIVQKLPVSPYLLVLVGTLFVLVIYLSIQTSSLGATLVNLEERQGELAKENRSMSSKLVNTNSLTSADLKAEELGFTKPQNVVYLNKVEPVAKLP